VGDAGRAGERGRAGGRVDAVERACIGRGDDTVSAKGWRDGRNWRKQNERMGCEGS
jgi:hypothetical protein